MTCRGNGQFCDLQSQPMVVAAGAQCLLWLHVPGLHDTVIILSDVSLISKSDLPSIVTLLLATHGTETTDLRTRI